LICCPLAYSIILTQLYPSYMAHILGFRITGHLWSQNDVNTSWLRLKATSNCFPHPYYTYTKCLSTLICCPLAYRYSSSLTQLYQSYLDQILGFRVTCVESKWCQYVVVEAGSHLKLLPHPYSTCTQCLSTLIWCPLAYSSSLKHLHPPSAYEGCETPYMFLTMKLKPSWMVLQPQQKHTTLLFPPREVPSMLGNFQ
jgi:hypothetical protein